MEEDLMATWNSWKPIPGNFSTDTMASACTDVTGKILYVVARRPDNDTIWLTHTDMNLQAWASWTEVPGGGITKLAPSISPTSIHGDIAVLGVGTNDGIYANVLVKNSSSWSGWTSLGGVTNAPVFGYRSGDTFRVFSKGLGDGKVYFNEAVTGSVGSPSGLPENGWLGWKHVPGDFLTDFAVTPSRVDPPDHNIMAVLGIRRSDHQVCIKFLDYYDYTGGNSNISNYPSGWTSLPYSAKTNAPLAASLTRGYAGFGKGIGNGKIYGLPNEGNFSEVPGQGVTNAGLSSATLIISKTQNTPGDIIVKYLVRNVLIAKGVNDNQLYYNYFDDEFSMLHDTQLP
jgi:hypothetical protein